MTSYQPSSAVVYTAPVGNDLEYFSFLSFFVGDFFKTIVVVHQQQIGRIQRRLAWPLHEDDTYKSRSLSKSNSNDNFFSLLKTMARPPVVASTPTRRMSCPVGG